MSFAPGWARCAFAAFAVALCIGLSPSRGAGAPAIPGSGSCEGCNVVFVSLDTLRPDRLEAYGYERPTSPTLRALAARSLVFDAAYSTSAATAEAHMSLFTSLYPSVHGVWTVYEKGEARKLPAGVPTLAALLKERGFATAGFHSGGHVSGALGFDRGFDVYEHNTFTTGPGWKATRDWLRGVGDGPFFLFLHTYHVHDPYTPGAARRESFAPGYSGPIVSDARELERRAARACGGRSDCSVWRQQHRLFWDPVRGEEHADREHLSSLYDAEIRELDSVLPRVLDAVEALARPTLLVILSDHGEAFREHGTFMHANLYEEIVRVPLLVVHPKAPHSAGLRSSEPVSLVDLAPTVLDWLGFDAPPALQGRALSRAASGSAAAPVIFAELPSRSMLAVRRGGLKLLLNASSEASGGAVLARAREIARRLGFSDPEGIHSVELYDLEADPGETRNLGARHPDLEPLLRVALERMGANRSHRERLDVAPTPAALSPDLVEQLEALGYLD